MEQIWNKFESGAYLDKIMFFEEKARFEIPDRRLLAMLVILAIVLDLVPKMIADEQLR